MKSCEITKTKDQWPDLTPMIGAEVVAVDLREADRALTLAFSANRKIIVPPHWQYASCLLAISSTDFASPNHDPENITELIGLCGAHLTAVESDAGHFDLILGSIRISVSHVTPPNL